MTEPKTILLVEDEALIALQEARQLQKEGYTVVQAYSGAEAIQKARSASPDLILMDIDLGQGIDGTQAAQEILKTDDIPIVFLSSHTEPEMVEKTEKITSYGYVVKNTGITVLTASIKMAFKLHSANQALRQANESLSLAQEASQSGAWNWDILHSTFDWSPAFRKLFGMPPDAVAGFESWTQALHPEDREIAGRRIQESIDNHTNLINDYRIVLPGGAVRWIRAVGKTYYDGNRPLRMSGLCMDITVQKQVEESLYESRALLQSYFDNLPALFFVKDLTGKVISVNKAFEVAFGLPSAQLLGKTDDDFYPPAEAETIRANDRFVAQTGTALQFEEPTPLADGPHIFLSTKFPIRSAAGDITAIAGVSFDITDWKRAEDALLESREAFRGYFNMGTVGMCVTSPEKGWVEVNDHLCNMLGYTRAELSCLTWAELTHPEDLYADIALFNQVTAGERDAYELDKRFIRKDGQVVYTILYVACQRRPDGTVNHFLASLVDITARKRAEEALRQALHEKEVLMRELQHRVKNSLNTVASLLSLGEDNLPDERSRAIFASTRARIHSILSVYEQLYRTGGIDRIDLRQYIQSLIESLSRSYLPESAQDCIEAWLADVQLDVKRALSVGIILNELITNALKYAFPAGVAPHGGPARIQVELRRSGDQVELCVADNGVGAPLDAPHPGGIGLDLVQILARQLDGGFSAESKDGYLARVSFRLE